MDCMDGMKEFPDKYFDLAIVDPPYGDARGGAVEQIRRTVPEVQQERITPSDSGRRTKITRTGGTWASKFGKKLYRGMLPQNRNTSKNCFASHVTRLSGGGNYFELPPTRCFLIWRKTNVSQKFSMAMAEYAWTSFNENAKVFDYSAVGQKGRFHPTQKPVALYEWILANYTKKGDIILDTHVGSASSLIACHRTRHKFVGFEIDKEYYDMANKRLQREQAQISIFDFIEQ